MRKFKGILARLVILSLFVIVIPAMAEAVQPTPSTELMLFQEIPMVTLPTRSPQPITEAPAAITVITADDIAHSGYLDFWDLLRNQPGVEVFDGTNNSVNYAGVSIRGFNAAYPEKIQVLMDGRTLFDPLVNGTFWTEQPIPLEDIERIEIMRGPDSVLYGFNAFNGIINIITKDPKKTKGVLTKVTAGSKYTQQYLGRVGDSLKKFDYRLSYARDNSQGMGRNGGREIADKKGLNSWNWRSRYTISDDKNIEFFAGDKVGPLGYKNYNLDIDVNYQQLKYNQSLSKDSSFFIQFFRNSTDKDKSYLPANQREIAYRQYDLEFQHNFKPQKRHNIVWGGGWRRNEGRLDIFPDPCHMYHDTILRAYMQDAIRLTNSFTYYTGVEWAQNNFTGSDWSTRQTLMYKLIKDHYLRATYGRAYHAFGLGTYYGNVGAVLANPNLERESIDAYELGYRGSFLDKKLSFDLEFFYNKINKIMTTLATTYANGDRADSEGVETSIEYRPFHWLKTYFNHSYISVDDKTELWKFVTPKHKVNLGACILMEKKYLPDYMDIKFYYVGKYTPSAGVRVPRYYKLDIKVAKKFFKDKMEVAFTALNLLDPHHFEYGNTLSIDRGYYGSVKVEF